LDKPNAKIYSRGFPVNLFCIFLTFISFSTNFRILNEFLEINLKKKSVKWKTHEQCWAGWLNPSAQAGPAGLAKGCGVLSSRSLRTGARAVATGGERHDKAERSDRESTRGVRAFCRV
jgi:hypothetical protein